jgi:hypothetical protein
LTQKWSFFTVFSVYARIFSFQIQEGWGTSHFEELLWVYNSCKTHLDLTWIDFPRPNIPEKKGFQKCFFSSFFGFSISQKRFSRVNWCLISRVAHSASNGILYIKNKVLELPEYRLSSDGSRTGFSIFFRFFSIFFWENGSIVTKKSFLDD